MRIKTKQKKLIKFLSKIIKVCMRLQNVDRLGKLIYLNVLSKFSKKGYLIKKNAKKCLLN